MVLQLSTICLRSLRDGVDKGKIQHFHLQSLPPVLRQTILDLVLMHGKIEHPLSSNLEMKKYSICAHFSRKCQQCRVGPMKTCIATPEFIGGMQSLSTVAGNSNDHIFLDRVSNVMATVLSNGAKIGDGISELRLKVYGCYRSECPPRAYATSIQSVIRLISQCPRLESLHLRLDIDYVYQKDYEKNKAKAGSLKNWMTKSPNNIFCSDTIFGVGIMNKFDALQPCLPIMENLIELSLTGYRFHRWDAMLTSKNPVIEFKRLKTLILKNASVSGVAWHSLMNIVQNTLTHLSLKKVRFLGDLNDVLPIPLPRLKSLTVNCASCRCTPSFVENLSKCPELEYLFFLVADQHYREESLSDLAKIDFCKVEIGLSLDWSWVEEALLDNSRFVPVIDLFKAKIRNVDIRMYDSYDRKFLPTLEYLFKMCQNLSHVIFYLPYDYQDEDTGPQLMRDVQEASLVLLPLFRDKERASRLRKLKLCGECDEEVLKLLFEHCLNLYSFKITNCQQLTDFHLIELVNRGAKLSSLDFDTCNNISDDGLIPILFNSGEKLKKFRTNLYTAVNPKITERTWRILGENCPYLELVEGIPSNLESMLRSVCFNGGIDMICFHEEENDWW